MNPRIFADEFQHHAGSWAALELTMLLGLKHYSRPRPGANTAYSLPSYPLLRMVAEPKIRSTDSSAHSHVLVIEFQDQICKSSSKRKDELNGQK
jgi:hypothetical protein